MVAFLLLRTFSKIILFSASGKMETSILGMIFFYELVVRLKIKPV